MYRISPVARDYAWGSTTAIPEFLGLEPTGTPYAEAWLGAHPSAPSPVRGSDSTGYATPSAPGLDLRAMIDADPNTMLGSDVVARFDATLPFLVKLLAPAQAVSLQVHPSAAQARESYARQQAAGTVFDDPSRGFSDPFHKPEMVYALSPFRGLVGFRARAESADLLARLDLPTIAPIVTLLAAEDDDRAVERAFTRLLTTVTTQTVDEVVARSALLATEHPAYAAVGEIARHYPGDTGLIASLMLNLVTLRPGEAVFVNDGVPHAYLSGLALEIMANSDNVIRAGLTIKHVDVPALLACADFRDASAAVLTGEPLGETTRVFRPDAAEFALAVITSATAATASSIASTVSAAGPSIVLALDGELTIGELTIGELTIGAGESALTLRQGEAAFLPANTGVLPVRGQGVLAQTFVPATAGHLPMPSASPLMK